MTIGFVCTNFNNADFTINAVKSLLANSRHNIWIAIVDNNSQPADGKKLKEHLGEYSTITIILSRFNVGYFAGLNLGVRVLRDAHPELNYIVIGNNDLLFADDFVDKVEGAKEAFSSSPVVAPDIVTIDGVHQNPHVIFKISRLRRLMYDCYYSNYGLAIMIRWIAIKTRPFSNRNDEEHWEKSGFISQGHGSCYILGPKFFDHFKQLWAPTILMGEEYFLSHQLAEKGYSVYYEPNIQVTHHYHATIARMPRRLMWEHGKNAHRVFRKCVKSAKEAKPRSPDEALINVNITNSSPALRLCTNCVMDTTDHLIVFDERGVCDHCNDFYKNTLPNWKTDDIGRAKLDELADSIRKAGKGKEFDSILGLSGGIDSSYMLHYVVRELGLRPLVFHVDGGWNSELAVHNIEVMVERLKLHLFTEVINWEEMRNFQLAFFKSGLPNIDLPQDHAFVATLYNFAEKYKIRHILNGGNISTEAIRNPLEWLYYGTDMSLIRDVQRQFCTIPLNTYPFSSVLRHKFYLRYIRGVKVIKPLNYIPYNQKGAIDTLTREYGWKAYPRKHDESRFTKFYEGFWLPERFGYDTRKVQFSSLILTGQMTRESALEALKKPSYDSTTIDHEFCYIATKLGISSDELWHYFRLPKKTHRDYRNQEGMFLLGAKFLRLIGAERSIKR